MSDPPREYTRKEMQDKYLQQIRAMIAYWKTEKNAPTLKEKMEGLAFSILVMLDGKSVLPGCEVKPYPHPDDKRYQITSGENYYPIGCDIAGDLHERWHKKEIERNATTGGPPLRDRAGFNRERG